MLASKTREITEAPVKSERTADRRNVLLCMLLFVAGAALVQPFLEMGVNDDWSYTYTAREFLTTGHITYNGWATAMLGPQVFWAALFIKLFGFSFLAVRSTTFIVALASIPALYYSAREIGLEPSYAAFATIL